MLNAPATRAHGLMLLERFQEGIGRRCTNGRNHDHGPGRHTAVSGLSPWVRRRLVTEAEWRREWDTAIWPHATAGFFKVKQQIPSIVAEMKLS